LNRKNFIVVEYPDGSSMVYEVPGEVEAVEEVTSEVFEKWNVKVRNSDGTYNWIRINPPSRGEEITIRTFDNRLNYSTTRSEVKKDPLTREWVK